jgi:hypothetical protein
MILVFLFYLITFVLGSFIGGSELVSRYRDAPFRALTTIPALVYIGINGLASLGALALVREMGWLSDLSTDDDKRLILQSLAAGLSAMALFRTSLFNIRVGNAEIGVGPAAFLQILLAAADRACDRTCAKPRAAAVQDIMKGISFARAKVAVPSLCFGLMQNVSTEEQATFGAVIAQLEKAEMEDVFKSNSLGLALMNLVGENVLREAVNMLREDIKAPPRPVVQSIQTLALLMTSNFSSAKQIIDGCLFLSSRITDKKLSEELDDGLKKATSMSVSDRQKILYLSATLIGIFGEEVVQQVLSTLPENKSPPAAVAAPPQPAAANSAGPEAVPAAQGDADVQPNPANDVAAEDAGGAPPDQALG